MYINAATAMRMGEELGGLKAEVEMRKQWKEEVVRVLTTQVAGLNARLDHAAGLTAPSPATPSLVLSVQDVQDWLLLDQERTQLHKLAPAFRALEIRGCDLRDLPRIFEYLAAESPPVLLTTRQKDQLEEKVRELRIAGRLPT
jgi:hypothetical protein